QIAMGDAFTALTGDVNLMRYNVGALGGIKAPMLAANFNSWIGDTQQGNLSFAYAIGRDRNDFAPIRERNYAKYGVVGLDVSYFDEGSIEKLDQFFNPLGGINTSGDLLAALAYGKYFQTGEWGIGIGLGGKFLQQSLVGQVSTAWAGDAGFQVRFPKILSVGASLQNYSFTGVKFDAWESPLTQLYRAGAALTLPLSDGENSSELILSGDAVMARHEKLRFFLGSELLLGNDFYLRGGYRINDPSSSAWAAGFGVNIPATSLGNSLIRLDYAYAPLPAFDEAAHRFSLHFAFRALKEEPFASAQYGGAPPDYSDLEKKLRDQLDKARQTAEELERLKRELENKLAQVNQIIAEDPGKMRFKADSTSGLLTVFFDFDKADIRPSEYPTMERVARILNLFPNALVQLSGHTDWIGEEDYNIHLSHRRLESVMKYLSEKEKVDPRRFFMPVGYGESKPIADNTTDEGRQLNRRVEFRIYYNQLPEIPEGTAIRSVRAVDDRTIIIECNGKIKPGKPLVLSNPDRFALTFENIFLIAEKNEIPLNRGPFIRARLGYTAEEKVKYTRVVFDLKHPIEGEQRGEKNTIIFKVTREKPARKPKLEQSLEKKEQ
ncbi:MAG: OmpA family protein, partial [candidate division KSB1 bacterium]|nr:OmpA family protein [candidate division KSB1 bacterium]